MKLNYRPDIDGLRAISVFAVIFYHANFLVLDHELFQGGFIGVDIFFVISGFLITSLILNEIYNDNFSITDFYTRRIRRIIPVLFFVILSCIPIAYIFLLPSSLVDFFQSVLSTLIFSSNFYFHHTGLIYGGPDSSLKPLLHTWSLSVEEQFYVIFPLILILFRKFLKNYIFHFFIIFFFIGFISTQIISTKFPLYNFYFINVRIWELLAGSIVAYLNINFIKYENKVTNYLPLLGLILILFSILFLRDEMSLPSIYSVPAVVGTCFIILFNNSENFITKVLSLKVFVFFGLISYSLYLWHFPLFAFYNYIFFDDESFIAKIIIILLSIILSILSYFFLEKPFRNKKVINNKRLLIYISLSFLIILSSSLFFLDKNKNNQKGLYEKVNIDNQVYFDEVNTKLKEIISINNFEKTNTKKNILIIGNSHAMDLFLMLKTNSNLFKNYNFEFSGFDLLKNELIEKDYNNEKTIKFKKIFKVSDTVLFSNRWSENDIVLLEKLINPILNTNKQIIIANHNVTLPSVGKRDVTLLDQYIINNKKLPQKSELIKLERQYFDYMINDNKRNRFNNQLKIIADQYNLSLLDKSAYQCNFENKRCKIFTPDGDKINYNAHHHTFNGLKYLGGVIHSINWLN
tara:strand:- start:327 stop:2222 length:1896 start_codon:yes stop_codon:yes gene_type:complete